VDLLLAITTIVSMELMIRKSWLGWGVCLANQGFWVYYLCSTKQYGLLLLTAAMVIQAIRGICAWRRPEENHEDIKTKHAADVHWCSCSRDVRQVASPTLQTRADDPIQDAPQ
jgi:hypothetical protein